jgi:GntR family transcriptional regulator
VLFVSYFHPRIGLTGSEDFTLHLYDILEKEHQAVPANSKEEISAILATNELAQKLRIKNNDPILFRKRLVSDVANRILEYNFCYYLASDFKYEITIKRPN